MNVEQLFIEYYKLQVKKEKLNDTLLQLSSHTGVKSPSLNRELGGTKQTIIDIMMKKEKVTDEIVEINVKLLELEMLTIGITDFEFELLLKWFNSNYKKEIEQEYISKGYSRATLYRRLAQAIGKVEAHIN